MALDSYSLALHLSSNLEKVSRATLRWVLNIKLEYCSATKLLLGKLSSLLENL